MDILTLRKNFDSIQSQHKQLDIKIKYERKYLASDQLRILYKLRAKLNKQLKELKIKLDLYS